MLFMFCCANCCFCLLCQASDRLKECQKRSTVARNEYLLSLSGSNAHLNKFYSEDLMELMKVCTSLVPGRWLLAAIRFAASQDL